MIFQCLSSVEGHRGGRSIESERAAIHRSANVDKSATKCNGD
jgi:hypothetical protein